MIGATALCCPVKLGESCVMIRDRSNSPGFKVRHRLFQRLDASARGQGYRGIGRMLGISYPIARLFGANAEVQGIKRDCHVAQGTLNRREVLCFKVCLVTRSSE